MNWLLIRFLSDPIFTGFSPLIVWQRFCEPARLRIAYCHGVNSAWVVFQFLLVFEPTSTSSCIFSDNQYLFYICQYCTSLPDKLSAEDRSFCLQLREMAKIFKDKWVHRISAFTVGWKMKVYLSLVGNWYLVEIIYEGL